MGRHRARLDDQGAVERSLCSDNRVSRRWRPRPVDIFGTAGDLLQRPSQSSALAAAINIDWLQAIGQASTASVGAQLGVVRFFALWLRQA